MSDLTAPQTELLVASFDPSGSFRSGNGAWSEVIGRTGGPWNGLDDADRSAATDLVAEAGRGRVTTGQLFLIPTGPGRDARPVLLNFLPVSGAAADAVDAVMVTGELLEQPESWTESHTERHRMETLGRMTMGMAHDFNNLLSGILGHAELMIGALSRAIDPEVLEEHVRTIERAANDGGELVSKIQRYIRQEKAAAHAPVDLSGLIQDCIVLTRPYWYNEPRRQGIAIAVEQRLDRVPAVLGSASELRDVLVNLILNAVQAMPEGGLITFRSWENQGQVCVSVQDTGTGMSEVVRARVFEPLFTTKGERGNGMGLAVSYGVIQQHGGTLGVVSELGAGSTFTVALPPVADAPTETADIAPAESVRALRILIVDDEPMVRTVLRRLLGLRGHTVAEADSGKAGLDVLDKDSFDVVISDQGMPEMSGREFAAVVADRHPGLPVLLLTGDTHAGTTDETIAAVLAKPFRIDDIVEALNRHT